MAESLDEQHDLFKRLSDYCDKIARVPQYDFLKFGDPIAPWDKPKEEPKKYEFFTSNSAGTEFNNLHDLINSKRY